MSYTNYSFFGIFLFYIVCTEAELLIFLRTEKYI